MALAPITVSRLIKIVSADPVASYRITSWLSTVPVLGPYTGSVRNMFFSLGQGLIDIGAQYAEGRWNVDMGKDYNPLNPNLEGSIGYELQCTGLAEAACAAIMKAKASVPAVANASVVARSSGFAHAGVLIETTDGGKYVVDWWLTLELKNPYLFLFDDWDQNISGSGVSYFHFKGFP